MVGPSLDTTTTTTIKFFCSYGGKIVPRHPDGKLRYLGGETRVLAVHRSISFSELSLKIGEMCGTAAILRCQLPTEDLDALVSITSDEDLANLIEEYDRVSSLPPLKIRAFLSPPKSTKKTVSPPSSSSSASSSSSTKSSSSNLVTAEHSSFSNYNNIPTLRVHLPAADRCFRQISPPIKPYPFYSEKPNKSKVPLIPHYARGNPSQIYLIHHRNHWQ